MNRVRILNKQIAIWNQDPVPEVKLNIEHFNAMYDDEKIFSGQIYLYFTVDGPKETLWEDRTYGGVLIFGNDFPLKPPIMKIFNIDHPNIYKTIDHTNGSIVCISILHEGIDETGYEDENSRWTPCHNIGSIFRSILTLFHEPFCESPANVDASLLYINDIEALRKIIKDR